MATLLDRLDRGDLTLPLGGPQLGVLDTGVIYDDIVAQLRRHRSEGVLLRSARTAALRLFAADHVYDEVYDSLDGFERRGVTRERVLSSFEAHYLPHIHFVSMPAASLSDRARRVPDADDVPTAALCELLAPSLPLAVDGDLLDHGYGLENWLTQTFAADEVLKLDTVLVVGAHAVHQATVRMTLGARQRVKTTTRAEAALGMALAAGVLALAPRLAAVITDAAGGLARTASTIAGGAALGAGQLVATRSARASGLANASVSRIGARSELDRVARTLATGPTSLSAQAIAARRGEDARRIEVMMRRHPAFVAHQGGWQLGRRLPPRTR